MYMHTKLILLFISPAYISKWDIVLLQLLLAVNLMLINFGVFLITSKDHFPPHIYYKVFTHRPVQDVGAFSPRDYTSSDFRRQTARDVHNKMPLRKPARGQESSLLSEIILCC